MLVSWIRSYCYFFQSNSPVVFPCEPTFWYCRRADGKGSDLLWAVVDRKESNSRFLPKSTLHVGSLALLCPGLLFPFFIKSLSISWPSKEICWFRFLFFFFYPFVSYFWGIFRLRVAREVYCATLSLQQGSFCNSPP